MGKAQGKQAFPFANAPANLGDLVKNYGMVKAYANGIYYDDTYYVAPATITLADDGDNSTTISDAHGFVADVTLQGRTLYKDGAWNTLCLPFSVDDFAGTPLEGATVKTLASTSFSNGTLTMDFTEDVSTIEAGKPYIVKWANGTDIESPVFTGVTISNVTANVETDFADFVGTYSPVSIYIDGKTNLYLGADNTLYYPTVEDFQVNACRGYFQLKGLTANSNQASIRAFKLNFGDDEATSVTTPLALGRGAGGEAWYTLDGRKLGGRSAEGRLQSKKPTQRGIYVNNGRKIIIK